MVELIRQVILQFKSQNQYLRFIKQSQKEYTIKNFRLSQFSFQEAEIRYKEIDDKYSNYEMEKMDNGWHQCERRLYIWFILCYMHYKLLDPIKFVHNQNCQKYWDKIAKTFWNKNIPLLQYQLLTIVKSKNRISWNKQQDSKLLQLYKQHTHGQWNQIAKALFIQTGKQYFKTAKHCRQRWQNHLNPQIKKGQWTNQQDYKILYYVKRIGCKWARIAQEFHKNRTQHMIKNRYKSLISKYKDEKDKRPQKQIIDKLLSEKQLLLSRRQKNSIKNSMYQSKKNSIKNNNEIQKCQTEEIQFFQSEQLIDQVQVRKKPVSNKKQTIAFKKDDSNIQSNRSQISESVRNGSNRRLHSVLSSNSFQRCAQEDAYNISNLYNINPNHNMLNSSYIYNGQTRKLPSFQENNMSLLASKNLHHSSSINPPQSSYFHSRRFNINQSIIPPSSRFDHVVCSNQSVFQKFIKQ